MAKRKTLKAEKRKILGRKVKKLRQKGILPANIYGKDIASTAIEIDMREFSKLFAETGETEIIDLQVSKGKSAHPVLIRDIQVDPVTDNPLHVDFMEVALTEKVEVNVPIECIGEAPAVKEGKGILLELLDELTIEALPTELPAKIEVDISNLKEVGAGIVVGDLKLPKAITVKTEPEELICKIEAPAVEEEKPATAEGAGESAEAQTEKLATAEDTEKSAETKEGKSRTSKK